MVLPIQKFQDRSVKLIAVTKMTSHPLPLLNTNYKQIEWACTMSTRNLVFTSTERPMTPVFFLIFLV